MKLILALTVAAFLAGGCGDLMNQFQNIRASYCAAVSDEERAQLRASFKERTGQELKIDCSQ